MLATGSCELPLINLTEIFSDDNQHGSEEIENILAAISAAWALGIEPELIRSGIQSSGFTQEKYNPGNQDFPIGLQTQGIKL